MNIYLIVNYNWGISCRLCNLPAHISVDDKTQQTTCGVRCNIGYILIRVQEKYM
jgi:hypothetical protein